MPTHNEQRNRNEAFGRLLSGAINSIATYEGKTAPVIEEELGTLALVAGKTIQRYKAGYLPPERRTIEILAEAAVQRGFLGRAWLQRFLQAARYAGAEPLLDRLCPAPVVRARPPRVYQNLPAPTYSQFVMRAQAFAEVCEGLAARSAAVLVVGLGGQGKTSLAREVADACLKGTEGAPQFDAAVWVSDKDRPGTTNLSVVLDEIARTLDYPGFTQFTHDEKRHEVEQLLRKQKVLLVIDNFETVTDGALLSWLLRLPEPSKALITSREYGRVFRNSTMVVELRGMHDAEAQALIVQRLRMLQLDKKASAPTEFEPLVAVTGGNPKAIEIALGLVKYERRPLQQVVDDLHAARGELFDDLFARAWSLLDEATRQVLMVMTFFPASASGEAVAASADVQGYAFDRAVERLTDLALLDVQHADLSSTPRYTLHPLVRAFVGEELKEKPEFEQQSRSRWASWYILFVEHIGYCWSNLSLLDRLDYEWKSTHQVIEWLKRNTGYVEIIQIAKGLSYYLYVRGLWQHNMNLCLLAAKSAHSIRDDNSEMEYMCYFIQILIKQGKVNEAFQYFPVIDNLAQSDDLSAETVLEYQFTRIIYLDRIRDFDSANTIRLEVIHLAERISPPKYIAIKANFTRNLFLLGKLSPEELNQIYIYLLEYAKEKQIWRAESFFYAHLSKVALAQDKIDESIRLIDESNTIAVRIQDSLSIAHNQLSFSHLHTLRGDLPAACAALAEAIDLYERLGMRRELAEARAELARLDGISVPDRT